MDFISCANRDGSCKSSHIYSAPEYIIQQTNSHYENCIRTWLEDTPFVSTSSSVVYSKVMKEAIKYANR